MNTGARIRTESAGFKVLPACQGTPDDPAGSRTQLAALKGRSPKPVDDRATTAGDGFEPSRLGSEPSIRSQRHPLTTRRNNNVRPDSEALETLASDPGWLPPQGPCYPRSASGARLSSAARHGSPPHLVRARQVHMPRGPRDDRREQAPGAFGDDPWQQPHDASHGCPPCTRAKRGCPTTPAASTAIPATTDSQVSEVRLFCHNLKRC